MGWFNHQLVTVCFNTNTWFKIRINVDDGSMSLIVITHLHLSAKEWLRIVPFKRNIVLFCVFQVVVFLKGVFFAVFFVVKQKYVFVYCRIIAGFFISSIITFTIGCVEACLKTTWHRSYKNLLGKSLESSLPMRVPLNFGWVCFLSRCNSLKNVNPLNRRPKFLSTNCVQLCCNDGNCFNQPPGTPWSRNTEVRFFARIRSSQLERGHGYQQIQGEWWVSGVVVGFFVQSYIPPKKLHHKEYQFLT